MTRDTDRRIAIDETWPMCQGCCQQGRKPCPVPQTCQLPEQEPEAPRVFRRLMLAIAVVLVIAVVVSRCVP